MVYSLKHLEEKFGNFLTEHKNTVRVSLAGLGMAGATGLVAAANYSPQYTGVDISTASNGIVYSFGMIVDCMTAIGNWFVTNAIGELCLGVFIFIVAMGAIMRLIGRARGRKK